MYAFSHPIPFAKETAPFARGDRGFESPFLRRRVPVSASLFRGCTRKGPLSIEELGGTAPPGLARSDRDRGRLSSRDFRALALFRRRPPERVEGFVIAGIRKPAQKRTFQPLSPGGMAVKPA